MILRPYIAIQGVWHDITQITRYTGDKLFKNPVAPLLDTYGLEDRVFKINYISRYRGIGSSLGIDGNWHMGCGLSIFGQMDKSISILKLCDMDMIQV